MGFLPEGDGQCFLEEFNFVEFTFPFVICLLNRWYNSSPVVLHVELEEEDEKQYKYPAEMLIQSYSQKRQEIQKLDRWVVLELSNKTLSWWNLVQSSLPYHHTDQVVNILTSLHISV